MQADYVVFRQSVPNWIVLVAITLTALLALLLIAFLFGKKRRR
jgi:hypothetical protein